MQLEEITPNVSLVGIEPNCIVTVVAVVPIADGARQVIYKIPDGSLRDRLLNRADEATISVAVTERPWAFDGDGELFKLVAEAKRIDLAFLFDPMMAVHTSNVDPLPHQITAVYESMLPKQPLRFVLADDPGAGKTIMAGLYIRELIMRADSRRILIVSPGSLVEQWRDEMFEKFGLEFRVYSRELESQTPSGNPFEDTDHLIVRLDQISRDEEEHGSDGKKAGPMQAKLLAAGWDLVICDEAHKLAAHFFGTKLEKTARFRFAERVGSRARHLLLMTATPHNGKEEDYQLFLVLPGSPGDFSLGRVDWSNAVDSKNARSPRVFGSPGRAYSPGPASPLRVATGGDASCRLEGRRRRSPAPENRRREFLLLGRKWKVHQEEILSGVSLWRVGCTGWRMQAEPRSGRVSAMQDFQLYQQILGLEAPWGVKAVHLRREQGEVEIQVECCENVWGCPECGQRMHVHEWERRQWRHLDSCQYKTIIVANIPRVKCLEHGTQTVAVPWAEKFGRFTRMFERLAIDLMLECSVKAACEILSISWEEADGIKQRAVARGLSRKQARPPQRLGVDEKAAGHGHDYVTVVARLDPGTTATVEYVGDGRKQEALDAYWQGIPETHRAAVEAVAMDMWDPYFNSTLAYVPDAAKKIVHDPFHIGRLLNEAVDRVRKGEHRCLQQAGDNRLARSKYLWLYTWENVPEGQQGRFDELRGQKLKTGRAWALKEMFRDFWKCRDEQEGGEYFRNWYSWAIRCRLEPMKKVARTLKARLANVLTYFRHRITNAALEGLNNRIAGLIKKAFGYRNRQRFKTDILFHLGGLELHPA